MTLNARFILKCTLRTARLTYVCVYCGFRIRPYTHRCSQRGRREVGWRACPTPCGQLTRCFSAVAELLVSFLLRMTTHVTQALLRVPEVLCACTTLIMCDDDDDDEVSALLSAFYLYLHTLYTISLIVHVCFGGGLKGDVHMVMKCPKSPLMLSKFSTRAANSNKTRKPC